MGLYISTMKELPTGDRSLYIYLLDYGWPEGPYEKLFKDNFGHLAARASETEAVVIMSGGGVHFANEVLDWHQICGHDASDILPAMLITHTHPNYFLNSNKFPVDRHYSETKNLGDIALVPLKSACKEPSEFLNLVSSIFDDLDNGLTLRSFRAERFDVLSHEQKRASIKNRVGKAFILQPNFGGIGIDLKKLFGATQ